MNAMTAQQHIARAEIALDDASRVDLYDSDWREHEASYLQWATAHAQIAQAMSLQPTTPHIFEISGDQLTDDMMVWHDDDGKWVPAPADNQWRNGYRYIAKMKESQ